MKLKMLTVVSVIVAIGLLSAPAHATNVTVSSATVTTIVGSDSGRAFVSLFNNSTNPVYYSKTSAGATVAAGMVLTSSATVNLEGFKGTVYGLAGPGASADVRYFTISR